MIELVSVHGGHSGQFCLHAQNSLEEIIQTYISRGFSWVGITEHAPPETLELMYKDQCRAEKTIEELQKEYATYMKECLRLKKKYHKEITIYAAMEIETCGHYQHYVPELIKRFQPEYIVGSVHHVLDMNFDGSPALYQKAMETVGGLTKMYAQYFDTQYEMIETLQPSVVGHFDLIRIYDANYAAQLKKPEIWKRIVRNLELVEKLDLILDYNQRALVRGAQEPYISQPILLMAQEMGIAVVPGDDSHSVESVGNFVKEAAQNLKNMGFSTNWKSPVSAM